MVSLSPEVVGALNQQLNSLARKIYVHPQEVTFTQWGGDNHEENVVQVAGILLDALKSLESNEFPQSFSSLRELGNFIHSRDTSFSLVGEGLDYKILKFLCADLQASFLLNKRSPPSVQHLAMEVDDTPAQTNATSSAANTLESSLDLQETAFELKKLSSLLCMTTEGLENIYDIIDQMHLTIQDKIQNKQLVLDHTIEGIVGEEEGGEEVENGGKLDSQIPSPQMSRILESRSVESLTSQQQEMLHYYEGALYNDYVVRKKMLLERLDVTLESFLSPFLTAGGEGEEGKGGSGHVGKGDKGELLRQAIVSHQGRLHRETKSYKVSDAFSAPSSLLVEHSQPLSSSLSRTTRTSLVKKALIGGVPDRGGRVNEMRGSKLGGRPAPFGKKHQGGGRGGGRGGDRPGGRGGGGGGRGEGDKNNHNNNNNSNSKPSGRTVTVVEEEKGEEVRSNNNNSNRDRKPFYKKQKR